MAKLTNYNGSIALISGIKQKNNQDFPLMEANAVAINEDDKRLDEELSDLNDKTGYLMKSAPIGTVFQWLGDIAPDKYAICDGRSLSKTDYADLFSIIGIKFGSDDNTTFKLPNQNNGAENINTELLPNYNYIIKIK